MAIVEVLEQALAVLVEERPPAVVTGSESAATVIVTGDTGVVEVAGEPPVLVTTEVGGQIVVEETTEAVTVTEQPIVVLAGVGPKGDRGEPGPQNLFIQPTTPAFEMESLWLQTGQGPGGNSTLLWVWTP